VTIAKRPLLRAQTEGKLVPICVNVTGKFGKADKSFDGPDAYKAYRIAA
jgi:hypothetical protein